jgi:hypothetical protein
MRAHLTADFARPSLAITLSQNALSSITSEVIVSQQRVRDYAERRGKRVKRGKRLDDRVVVCKHAPVPLAEAQTAPAEK